MKLLSDSKNSKAFPTLTEAKLSNGQKRVLYTILSFVIPMIVMVLGLIALHVTPFGDHNLAISDGKFYVNGELAFGRLLKGQTNLLYSLQNGLGGNNWSQLAWGGFSFGGLLSVFGTLETMPSIFTWICVLNIAICGLTMYLLLAYLNGHRLSNLIFSTSYALIGFNVVNCYQALFFMGPQMLPLMMLGLVKLLRSENPFTYILSLAWCIFFDFYFGFHLCVMSVIFFLAYLYVNNDELIGKRKPLFFTWAASSLIAGLLAAPVWIPTIKAYSGGGRLNQTGISEYTFSENMPFIQIFSKLFSGANSTNELVVGLPNIFCGILVIALVVLFFMNKNIDIRRKRAAAVVLGFYLLTFYLHAFTLVMHGGTHTNWFPYRYSYVFSFLLICIAMEEFRHLDEITIADTKKCGTALLIIAILVFSTSYEFISGGTVVLDFALLLLMWLGFWLYKTKPEQTPERILSLFLIIVVCGNMYANFTVSIKKMQDWELDLDEYRENTLVSGSLIDGVNQAEEAFFRMEKDRSESSSVAADPALYNYHGVSHSGPGERMFIHQGLCKLGVNWFDMRHWYSEGIPAATDVLLGLKYLISEKDLTEEKGYEYKLEMNGYKLFQNPYPLSVAVLANAGVKNVELGENIFDNLNDVWKSMTGEEKDIFTSQKDVTFRALNAVADEEVNSEELVDFFKQYEADASSSSSGESSVNDAQASKDGQTAEVEYKGTYIEYSFTAVKDGPVYVFDTSIPGSKQGLAVPAIKFCGTYKEGDEVTGKLELGGQDYITEDFLKGHCANLAFAVADNNVLSEYADLLNDRNISFEVVHDNDLTGSFNADSGQRILFTLPWDEGWKCYIDGKEVAIDKTWDLFMSVEVPEGEHCYEMKFFPAWMNYGLYLCAAAFIGLIALVTVWNRKRKATDQTTIVDGPTEEIEVIQEIR